MSEVRKLNQHQIAFLRAQEQYVGLFGGVGNGKTYIACLAIIQHATQNEKNLSLIGRQTYPELRDSTREVFLSTLSSVYPEKAYKLNKAENSVIFWNGSIVIFRHLDNWKNLLSMNLGTFYIDQAEEVEEDAFLTLQSRLRRSGVKRLQGYVTGNPAGHNWIYYKFGMDRAGNANNWVHDTDYRMITAPTIANSTNLPSNYIEQLQRSYSKEWFDRYVLGSWDAFEGQIFDLTKITGYEKLPKIQMVFTACDPAISKEKTACNTAFCTLGYGEDGHVYDLETVADKWSFLETLEQAKGVVSRQRPQYLGVESAGYQQALVEACQRYFPEIQVLDMKADKDKFRRAKSISHIISKGLFHTNNKDLLSEISAFNPDAKGKEKKDRVDAMVHCMHLLQQYAPCRWKEVSENEKFKGMDSSQAFFKQTRDWANKQMRGESHFEEFSTIDSIIDPEYY